MKKTAAQLSREIAEALTTPAQAAQGWGDRDFHEGRVVELVDATNRLLPSIGEGYCEGRAIRALIQANRHVAQARTHLVSIGPHEGKRTRRLFAVVSKLERRLKTVTDKTIAKCPRD
jgi:hypothetical protein